MREFDQVLKGGGRESKPQKDCGPHYTYEVKLEANRASHLPLVNWDLS